MFVLAMSSSYFQVSWQELFWKKVDEQKVAYRDIVNEMSY